MKEAFQFDLFCSDCCLEQKRSNKCKYNALYERVHIREARTRCLD